MTSDDDLLRYYAAPGPLTKVAEPDGGLESLPDGLTAIVEAIHGLGIYDVVASDFYGVDLPDDRAGEIHRRSIDEMLAGLRSLDESALTRERPPERRLPMRCGGYTKLVVSALRARAIPARARCGFAAYFKPAHFEDHWVAEVWDSNERRWRLVDAQIDDVWRARLGIEDDVLDLSRERFLVAAEAWRRCRRGDADPQRFGISFGGLHGLAFVAGNLVRDLAALNKVEMLPWDVWGAQPAPDAELSDAEISLFDRLADLTLDPDAHFAEVRERYAEDEAVRVRGVVTNALLDRSETVQV